MALRDDLIIPGCENSAVAEEGENDGPFSWTIMLAGRKVAGLYPRLLPG